MAGKLVITTGTSCCGRKETFLPSFEWITLGLPPSITATHEFVVPKSIPIFFVNRPI